MRYLQESLTNFFYIELFMQKNTSARNIVKLHIVTSYQEIMMS